VLLTLVSCSVFVFASATWAYMILHLPNFTIVSDYWIAARPRFYCGCTPGGLEITKYFPLSADVIGPDEERAADAWWQAMLATDFSERILGFELHRSARALDADTPAQVGPVLLGHDYSLVIPYWFMLAASAIAPAFTLRKLIRHLHNSRRRAAGFCHRCGYDLRATPLRCPECGASAMEPVNSSR